MSAATRSVVTEARPIASLRLVGATYGRLISEAHHRNFVITVTTMTILHVDEYDSGCRERTNGEKSATETSALIVNGNQWSYKN